MEQKIEEFKQQVRGYQGVYPLWELEKFIKYYTEKKPFYKIKGFTLSRRLKTWFDKEAGKKRLDNYKAKQKNKIEKSQVDSNLQETLNFLGLKARIIK